MQEGTLVRWLKKEGEPIAEGEAIAEIETDKAAMEIEAFVTGTISRLLIKEGDVAPVGSAIAEVREEGDAAASTASSASASATDGAAQVGESIPAEEPAPSSASSAAREATAAPAPADLPGANGDGGRLLVSPLARKMATEAGVNLHALRGTGPRGRIVEADVATFIESGVIAPAPAAPSRPSEAPRVAEPKPEPKSEPARPAPPVHPVQPAAPAPAVGPGEDRKLSNMRKTIARRLVDSKQQIPHFYVTTDVDMGAAKAFLAQLKAVAVEGQPRPTLTDLIVKACALALVQYPGVNAQWRGDTIHYPASVNIGNAVSVEEGLFVPVVRDCQSKTLRQIAGEMRPLIEKARAGKLAPSEYEAGTFSISNLGMFDVESFIAIVNPPQSAILAVGSILDQVVAVDGQIVIRPRMKITLSGDHRVVDGVLGAQFLQAVKAALQSPMMLVE